MEDSPFGGALVAINRACRLGFGYFDRRRCTGNGQMLRYPTERSEILPRISLHFPLPTYRPDLRYPSAPWTSLG